MICFAVALRSQYSTNNWESVLRNFNNTIHSIFQQTCNEFRVYVGCSEIPDLFEEYDDRLRFVTVDLPIPRSWEEGCRDRSWKLLACARQIKRDWNELEVSGGVFVFPVDADDFVNCNIAQYVHDHPEANGFKSKTGYRWIQGKRHMEITPYFGGSMNIMKMYPNDLPDSLPDQSLCFDKETAQMLTERYPIRWYDIEAEHKFSANGRPFSNLPFKSTIYVLGTGANISATAPENGKVNSRKFHPIAFLRKVNPFTKRYFSKRIKKEFGIPL